MLEEEGIGCIGTIESFFDTIPMINRFGSCPWNKLFSIFDLNPVPIVKVLTSTLRIGNLALC